MSTAAAAAAEAATTDWTTYDGVVPQDLMFYAVFFPVVMGALLVIPATICYLCLARGRVTPYAPPNMPGGFDSKSPYHGSVNHGSVAQS